MLIERALQKSFRVWAIGAPFDSKDKLKELGYRWDGTQRCWYRNCMTQQDADNQISNLQGIYDAHAARIQIQTAKTRFKEV